MRIWSLLPSATEILFALGLGEQVTGVTHECDFPPDAATKPRVTTSYIDSSRPSAEIDRQVTERLRSGQPLYGIVDEELRRNPPDVIVTQDLCPVCAVSPTDFTKHLDMAGCSARVITLNPNLLEDVLGDIREIGLATDRGDEAGRLIEALERRIENVRRAVDGAPRPRTLCLEWLDPPMPGGHWLPQMVYLAGGESKPIAPGQPSRKVAWEELAALQPEVIALMPCGFVGERAVREAAVLTGLPGWQELPAVRSGRVYVTDGNAFFSRPGPRLVDGLETLAVMLHPDRWSKAPKGSILRLPAKALPGHRPASA